MNTQLRWIAAAVAALAVGQVSAQGYQGYTNPNYARGNGYGNGYTHVVRCESYSGRSNFCRVNAQGRVFIVRQLSQQRCMRGRNWNADIRGIWVGGGCRADFAIAPRRGYRQGGGYMAVQGGGYGMQGGGYGMQGGGYGMNVNGARGWNGDPGYMNNQARANDYRGDPNRAAGYNDPRYGNNNPRYANTDPRYNNNDPRYNNTDPRYNNTYPRYNNDPRAMNHSRDDDRDSDQDAGAPPDDPGYYNQPQH